MSKAVLGVLVVCRLIVADPVCAQTAAAADSEYLRLVVASAQGEIPHDTDALAGWSDSLLEKTVQRALVAPAINRKAAVMLHTESAFATIGSLRSALHLKLAQLFLDRISGDGADSFKAQWQACVEILKNVLRSRHDGGEDEIARRLGESDRETRLLRRYDDPRSGAVEFAAGLYQELETERSEDNLLGRWHSHARVPADTDAQNVRMPANTNGRNFAVDLPFSVQWSLNDAIAHYRHALAKEPDLLEARLRLGWVLLVHRSRPEAREQLDQVIARATDARIQYLAHLFTGAIEEAEQHPSEALHEYERAYAIVPGEAAAVALMRAAMLQGLRDEVQQVVNALAGRSASADRSDPWHLFLHGVTNDTPLEQLRAEARTR